VYDIEGASPATPRRDNVHALAVEKRSRRSCRFVQVVSADLPNAGASTSPPSSLFPILCLHRTRGPINRLKAVRLPGPTMLPRTPTQSTQRRGASLWLRYLKS